MTTAQSTTLETDRALLDHVARGEERALGLLYDRYSRAMYALAHRITGERADAEEAVLEAFSQLWREAARFRSDKGSVIAWLTTICRSRALDVVRSRGRRGRLAVTAMSADPDRAPGMGTSESDPSLPAEHNERVRKVATALAELPAPQRSAIELAYYEGLSQTEIAERLGEPLGTIKTRVRLAMDKLRDALRGYHAGGLS